MSESKELTVAHPSALDVYGQGTDIKTLADRIKICLPGGDKLSVHETLALAQLSIAYNLNPFNGEVWVIPGKGTMVGIKGLRKAARSQLQPGNGNYWTEFILPTPDERRALAIPDTAIAYKCLVYRTDLIRQSAESIKLMYDAGMKDAAERYAYRPTEGVGYATPGESSKMKTDQLARKRAETEALRRAFDLPFAVAGQGPNGHATIGYVDAEEAEWQPVPESPLQPEPPPEPPPEPQPVAVPTPKPKPLPPTPVAITPPKPEPAPGRVKVAAVRSQNWTAAGTKLAAEVPYYMKAGQVDWFHLTGAAAKLGYHTITDDNLADVLGALRQYAADQQALKGAPQPALPLGAPDKPSAEMTADELADWFDGRVPLDDEVPPL